MKEAMDVLLWRGRRSIILLGSSLASPSRPSDKNSVRAKTIEWSEVVAWDRGRGILLN
jgi:hypothetical protein